MYTNSTFFLLKSLHIFHGFISSSPNYTKRSLLSLIKSVEREVGGGIGMGSTCRPMAVSFQCLTKFTTNKKKKREREKKIYGYIPWVRFSHFIIENNNTNFLKDIYMVFSNFWEIWNTGRRGKADFTKYIAAIFTPTLTW